MRQAQKLVGLWRVIYLTLTIGALSAFGAMGARAHGDRRPITVRDDNLWIASGLVRKIPTDKSQYRSTSEASRIRARTVGLPILAATFYPIKAGNRRRRALNLIRRPQPWSDV